MTALVLCQRLAHSALSGALQGSRWAFPIIETIHLLALAVFGGALLAFTLHLMGLVLPQRHPGDVLRELKPVLLGGLSALLASGLLLFASGPLPYYGNAAFRIKLALIVCGTTLGLCTWWAARREPASGPASATLKVSATLKILAVLTAMLWLGAGIAGRMIGLL
jgi:hypothetical protein